MLKLKDASQDALKKGLVGIDDKVGLFSSTGAERLARLAFKELNKVDSPDATTRANASRVKELGRRSKEGQLRLSEAQEIKQLADSVLPTFSKTGETLSRAQAKSNVNQLGSLRREIEKRAGRDLPVKELNKQIRLGRTLGDILDEPVGKAGVVASAAESVLGGGLGFGFGGVPGGLVGILGFKVSVAALKTPRVQLALTRAAKNLSNSEQRVFEGIRKGVRPTPVQKRVLRKIFKAAIKLAPELRLAGKTPRTDNE